MTDTLIDTLERILPPSMFKLLVILYAFFLHGALGSTLQVGK